MARAEAASQVAPAPAPVAQGQFGWSFNSGSFQLVSANRLEAHGGNGGSYFVRREPMKDGDIVTFTVVGGMVALGVACASFNVSNPTRDSWAGAALGRIVGQVVRQRHLCVC